jgi:hypothetical protein
MHAIPFKLNFTYWVHLFITVLSWFIPFLFDWRIGLSIYAIILGQFLVFDRCLLNRAHALEDTGTDHTFYAHLMEQLGMTVDRPKVKAFVRSYIYVVLSGMAIAWQVWLGKPPIIL